ncbi:MAG: hypothetical protein V3T83_16760, partial [Acidobacteriota bacterium]
VTVQLPPLGDDAPEDQKRKAAEYQDYLNEYFGKIQMSVFWGTVRQFMQELNSRWARFSENGHGS